jgi:hypothetical protein
LRLKAKRKASRAPYRLATAGKEILFLPRLYYREKMQGDLSSEWGICQQAKQHPGDVMAAADTLFRMQNWMGRIWAFDEASRRDGVKGSREDNEMCFGCAREEAPFSCLKNRDWCDLLFLDWLPSLVVY